MTIPKTISTTNKKRKRIKLILVLSFIKVTNLEKARTIKIKRRYIEEDDKSFSCNLKIAKTEKVKTTVEKTLPKITRINLMMSSDK